MAFEFYDENDPRKKRHLMGDKTPIDMPKEIAKNAGASTPVGIYTKADGTKMVMPKVQPFKIRKLKGKGALPPV
tara:strand:+ start:219 stop:440 length:222 start_codon:yes stop_codon:yes gene_type:complete